MRAALWGVATGDRTSWYTSGMEGTSTAVVHGAVGRATHLPSRGHAAREHLARVGADHRAVLAEIALP